MCRSRHQRRQQPEAAEGSAAAADPVLDLFDRAAEHYDVDTRPDIYHHLAGLYRDVVVEHGAPGTALVDLGCGTGKATVRFGPLGYRVTGIDLSPGMLRVAREKPGSEQVTYLVGDLRRLPDVGPFDVAVTVGEALHYLADEAELAATFASVARILTPGGVFVFDLHTSGQFRRLRNLSRVDDQGDALTLWRFCDSPRDDRGLLVHVDRLRTDDDGETWRRSGYDHVLSYFSAEQVEQQLAASGLIVEGVYGLRGGVRQPHADEQADEQRLTVARRPARR